VQTIIVSFDIAIKKIKFNAMSNENKSIHEFDFDLICEYFSSIQRQGPGSPDATIKALSFIDNLTDTSKILDLGCGTGGQTITIGLNAPGHITGIDLFPKFIDLFNLNSKKHGLSSRVKGIVGSMEAIPFNHEEFDLIWSEGAIYNIGFERGLIEWRKLLKVGGYIAITDASWFTESRPEEINNFWVNEYPGIDTISNKIAQLQKAGYVPIASFILPETCWTDHFYIPQVEAQRIFLKKHKGNSLAEELVQNQQVEANLYSKYKEFYGYVFYIGKKI
jgi:SAM-dependent methyltransferase